MEVTTTKTKINITRKAKNIRKYTLFSAYGSTASGSMFSIAFAIGNEIKDSWGNFWKFAVKQHPSINDASIT